jgi:hypothetical protein
MPMDFGKKLTVKLGDIKTRVRSDWTTIVWKDKQNVNMLMNVHHHPPAEINFYDEYGYTLKPATV